MDCKTFKLLAEYNRKTNWEMNGLIQKLDASEWHQEFKGYFKSVHSLCNHIYLGDFNWLKRFSKLRPFTYIQKEVFKQELPFSSVVFETIGDYSAKREELDHLLLEFINEISEEDLHQILEYVDSHGKLYKRLFGGLILHCFNHQTHHRGMISIYLENMGITNDFSNLAGMV